VQNSGLNRGRLMVSQALLRNAGVQKKTKKNTRRLPARKSLNLGQSRQQANVVLVLCRRGSHLAREEEALARQRHRGKRTEDSQTNNGGVGEGEERQMFFGPKRGTSRR